MLISVVERLFEKNIFIQKHPYWNHELMNWLIIQNVYKVLAKINIFLLGKPIILQIIYKKEKIVSNKDYYSMRQVTIMSNEDWKKKFKMKRNSRFVHKFFHIVIFVVRKIIIVALCNIWWYSEIVLVLHTKRM